MTGRRSTLTALLALSLALSLHAACGAARTVPTAVTTAAPAAVAPAAQDPEAIRWVRDSAEYRAALIQVYRAAMSRVEQEAASRTAGTWGVILDADETVISNVMYQIERARAGLPYTSESWNAWVRRREAVPLPAAPAFLTRVRALGGRIAIVTNRYQSECEDTEAVFRRHGLVYDRMFCRPDGGSSDKNPRFAEAAVALGAGGAPIDIVAFVGDNIHDFPNLSQAVRTAADAAFAEFGVRYFVVPNPMYGGWQ